METNDPLGNSQPQAAPSREAITRFLHSVEGAKELLQSVIWNTWTVVSDRDHGIPLIIEP